MPPASPQCHDLARNLGIAGFKWNKVVAARKADADVGMGLADLIDGLDKQEADQCGAIHRDGSRHGFTRASSAAGNFLEFLIRQFCKAFELKRNFWVGV